MRLRLSDISFPTSIQVTEQTVDLSTLSEIQKQFYINLLHEIITLYTRQPNKRWVVGFAGPSGSGKSVLVEIVKQLSQMAELPFEIETLGIDAYSFSNNYLLSKTNQGVPLKEYKGRYDTYNVEKLLDDLVAFKKGKNISVPIYSRKTHNPIENMVTLTTERTVLLLEGLWVLSDKDNWGEVRNQVDYCFFVNADKEKVRELTIARHIAGGRVKDDAERYYDTVDISNYEEVMKTAAHANKTLLSFTDF